MAAAAAIGGFVLVRGSDDAGRATSAEPLPDPTRDWLRRAQLLLKESDPLPVPEKIREAIGLLAKAESLSPTSADVAFWRGMACVMAKDRPAAQVAIHDVRERSPRGDQDARVHYLQAMSMLAFAEPPLDALKQTRIARSLAPRWMPELVDLATCRALKRVAIDLLDTNKPDQAIQALKEAVGLVRQNPTEVLEMRRLLVQGYGRAARFLEAEEEAKALLTERRENLDVAEFHLLYAQTLLEQKKWEAAAPEYSEVLRLLAAHRVPISDAWRLEIARLRLGDCLRYTGHVEDGVREVEAYVAAHPEDARGHYVLGEVCFDALDEPERAIAAWERARSLAPWCEEPLMALLRVYEVAKHDPAKAKALKDEIESGKEARRKERARQAALHSDGSLVCG